MDQTSSSQAPDGWTHSSGNERTGGIAVACAICDATFTFSATAEGLQLSADTLETVFMSVCHFCFRCRRLACPECWDGLHRLCGACVREADLPFRTAAPSLRGASLSSAALQDIPSPANPSSSALLCVRAGHFQRAPDATAAPAEPSTSPASASRLLMLSDSQGAQQLDGRAQKVMYYIPLLPQDDQKQAGEPEREMLSPLVRIANAAEQLATAIAFCLLLVISVLIVLAALSPAANLQIMRLLHIDIRSEIAYLTNLVQQLHW